MKLCRRLSKSLSDITEEDNDEILSESSSDSLEHPDFRQKKSSTSWKSIINCNLPQQRIVKLTEIKNDDTTYLIYNLLDESKARNYKTKKISCDMEYSSAKNGSIFNEEIEADRILRDQCFAPQTTIMIFIAPVLHIII